MKTQVVICLFSLLISYKTLSQEKLTDFKLPMFEKEEMLSLNQLKADKIVINFFASWCTACMKEIPELNHLKEQVDKKEKVIFLAINADEKDFKISKFLKKTKFSYLILKDPGLKYSLSIGVDQLPRTFVLDSEKRILYSSDVPPEKI